MPKKTKELKPIRIKTDDFDALEEEISDLFRREIYLPLIRILGASSKTLKNTKEDVADAIAKGRISYSRGKFTGRFNASISRELKSIGAKWHGGGWNITKTNLPSGIKTAISTSASRFARTLAKIDAALSKLLPEKIAGKLKASQIFDTAIWRVDRDIKSTLKDITVSPVLTKVQRAKIAKEYSNNMELHIQEWTQGEIKQLRKDVEKNVMAGRRYEDMIDSIETRYQVSRTKAKFLARQETNLLMTKFKETRYTSAGVNHYRWGNVAGSKNHPVRPMHKRLDGKVFRWDEPPITSDSGDRNNPGEDYNCRCFARPIVRY